MVAWTQVSQPIDVKKTIAQRYGDSRKRTMSIFNEARHLTVYDPYAIPESRRYRLRWLDRIEAHALLMLAEDFPK
jgi:hypothetical protein